MELKTCENGHAYDASLSSCPFCTNDGATSAGGAEFESVGKTQPVDQSSFAGSDNTTPVNQEFDIYGKTEPVSGGDFEMVGKTEPVSLGSIGASTGDFTFRPVVGWLVCIEGPNRGVSYPIHPGYNYIGRTPDRDIYIPNDATISAKQAWIAYDKSEDGLSDTFAFGPSEGTNTCRVNGKAQYSAVDLSPYDSIKLGNSKFLFVPFCSDKFRW